MAAVENDQRRHRCRSRGSAPMASTVDTATTNALRRVIAQLSHDDQLILALRSVEQLTFSEISQRLGIEEATARQRHHRARARLRDRAAQDETLHSYTTEVNQ